MRSLFHFPLPCTTTPAVTVSYSNRPTAARNVPSPASCTHAPPAPLPSVAFRRPPAPPVPRLPRSGPRPTVTRSQGARHAAPPSLPRAAARSHRAPSPEYRPAAACTASPASRPPRAAIRIPLCRHRADPALIAPPSRPSCAAAVLHVLRFAVRIAPTVRRHPRHPPPSLSSRCGGPRALAGKNRAVCIPFSPNALKRPPSWQHPPEMHALRDQNGNILAPCIHFRAQSGDSGYMARESCRQGPFSASRSPKSRMVRRCCQRRPAFLRQQPAVRRNGLCAMRQRHVTRGMAERALRPAARAWPACRMRAPCHLACARRGLRPLPSRPRSSPPSYTCRASLPASRPPRAAIRRVAHCSRGEPPIGLFLPPSCCPRRRIAPIDARSPAPPGPRPARTEPQPRANRTPAPRQPSPGPPVEPSAPTRAPPPAAPHPAARVPLRFR